MNENQPTSKTNYHPFPDHHLEADSSPSPHKLAYEPKYQGFRYKRNGRNGRTCKRPGTPCVSKRSSTAAKLNWAPTSHYQFLRPTYQQSIPCQKAKPLTGVLAQHLQFIPCQKFPIHSLVPLNAKLSDPELTKTQSNRRIARGTFWPSFDASFRRSPSVRWPEPRLNPGRLRRQATKV